MVTNDSFIKDNLQKTCLVLKELFFSFPQNIIRTFQKYLSPKNYLEYLQTTRQILQLKSSQIDNDNSTPAPKNQIKSTSPVQLSSIESPAELENIINRLKLKILIDHLSKPSLKN